MKNAIQSIALILLLTACATAPYTGESNFNMGISALNTNNHALAYRFLEEINDSNKDRARSIIASDIRFLDAAKSTFSQNSIEQSIIKYGRETSAEIEIRRANLFKANFPGSEENYAYEQVAHFFPKEVAAFIAKEKERHQVSLMSEAEQIEYWKKLNAEDVQNRTIFGVIVDRQLIDASRKQTNHASNLGSAIAKAQYLDSTPFQQFSTTGYLSANILGAALGAAFDQKASTRFLKIYHLRKADGSLIEVRQEDGDAFMLPMTACIKYTKPYRVEAASKNECE